MRMSEKGLTLLKEFEGCILKAYKCPAGVWTIGYGSTGPHVKPGMVITKRYALDLLTEDLDRFEKAVIKAVSPTLPEQEEFDAMVSLAFNIGIGAFSKSSVVRNYKKGDRSSAASAFGMWNKARVNGNLVVLAGLTRRRAAEKQLFLSAGAPRLATRSMGTKTRVKVPEESVVPEAPKSLAKSREIILGSGLGIGGVTEFVSSVSSEDLSETKSTISEVGHATQDTFMEKYHIPEVAALLCGVIGAFMIWKRWKDRKAGIR
jgi:lysozyme